MSKVAGKLSSRFRFFVGVILFFGVAQWLVGLDYITVWPGVESQFVSEPPRFYAWLHALPLHDGLWLFGRRIGLVVLNTGALVLFWRWSRRLLDEQALLYALLLACASFLLIPLSKSLSLEGFSWGAHLLLWAASLRALKTPSARWYAAYVVTALLAVLLGGWAGVLFVMLLYVGYNALSIYLRTWQVARYFHVSSWLSIVLVIALAYFGFGWGDAGVARFSPLAGGQLKLLGWSLLACAPFIGFTVAALRDLVYKLRKREELAGLLALGLVATWLSGSLAFTFLLLFISGRQLLLYFSPNYPWENWVKTAALLHLVGSFIAIVLVLLGGFLQFQTEGFRTFVGCAFAYWIFGFIGIIGLYGRRRDYIIGGPLLAGAVTMLFFWVQVYPFFHLQRNMPERLVTFMQKEAPSTKTVYWHTAEEIPNALPYLERAGYHVAFTAPDAPYWKVTSTATDSLATLSGWQGLGTTAHWVVQKVE